MTEEPLDLDKRVRSWLVTSGASLEMRVAAALRGRVDRHMVEHGPHYLDLDTGKPREIDVFATWTERHRQVGRAYVCAVIECKSGKDPWTIFIDDRARPLKVSEVWSLLEMVDGFALWQHEDLPRGFADSKWVQDLRSPGSGVKTAFKKEDAAYDAVQQAIAAMRGLAKRLGDDSSNIYLPVVVTKSPLFEAYLDDKDEITVREVRRRSILIRHPLAHVMIVNEAGLDEMVDDLDFLAQALLHDLG